MADRGRYARGLLAATLLAATLAASCSSGSDSTPDGPSTDTATTTPTASTRQSDPAPPTADAEIPAEHRAAAEELFDTINVAAGGEVADQRAAFQAVVDPGAAERQRTCPDAAVTVEFRPVWSSLQPDPEYRTDFEALDGAPYRVPALVEVFTGERRTGTDLAMVHLWVTADGAHTTPWCLA